MTENRQRHKVLPNGLTLYRVKLIGGPFHGKESLCSHETVIMGGETYLRGPDDVYYHQAKSTGRERGLTE